MEKIKEEKWIIYVPFFTIQMPIYFMFLALTRYEFIEALGYATIVRGFRLGVSLRFPCLIDDVLSVYPTVERPNPYKRIEVHTLI